MSKLYGKEVASTSPMAPDYRRTGQVPTPGFPGGTPLLFGWDGKPLPIEAYHSPIDFGPGAPLLPRMPDKNRAPREWQYPVGFNLIPQPRYEIPGARFSELRTLALACPYARIAINHRKKQMRGLNWDISPIDDKTPKAKKENLGKIGRIKKFFQKPNQIDGLRFGEWVGQALEESLVTDALTFFKYPAKDGSLYSLVQVDGATIKPLIDEFGHVVGYQQILYGYPSTQYAQTQLVRDADELEGRILYLVSNPKVDNVYGTSPIEEIRPMIDLGIRRIVNQLAWYTDGNIMSAVLECPGDWSEDTISRVQQYLDDNFSGDESQRHKVRLIPAGSKLTQLKPFQFNKDEEEALIAAVCAHFGVPRSLFIAQVNKATAESQRDEAQDTGLKPIKVFFKDFFDDIIEHDLDGEGIEFDWIDTPAGSEKEVAESFATYINAGIMTVDEVRAEKGMDPMPKEELDRIAADKAAELAAKVPFGQPQAVALKPGEKPDEKKPAAPNVDEKPAPSEKTILDELRTWERFALKRVARGHQADAFTVTAVPETVRDYVAGSLPLAKNEAGVKSLFHFAIDKAKHPKRLTVQRVKHYEDQIARIVLNHLNEQKRDAIAHYEKAVA